MWYDKYIKKLIYVEYLSWFDLEVLIVSYMVVIIFIGDCVILNDFFFGKIYIVCGC